MTRGGLTEDELRGLMDWAAEVITRRRGSTPTCPFCGDPMVYRSGNVHEKPKAWGQNWTCPCHHLASFRVPLDEEEYQKTRSMMGGTSHTPLIGEKANEYDRLTERLRDLGYIQM